MYHLSGICTGVVNDTKINAHEKKIHVHYTIEKTYLYQYFETVNETHTCGTLMHGLP